MKKSTIQFLNTKKAQLTITFTVLDDSFKLPNTYYTHNLSPEVEIENEERINDFQTHYSGVAKYTDLTLDQAVDLVQTIGNSECYTIEMTE